MYKFIKILCSLVILYTIVFNVTAQTQSKINFDKAWKFTLSGNHEAINPTFNDNSWRTLDLPHDWSIEGTYSETNGGDWQSGFLPTGTGWYRKSFNYDPKWKNSLVSINFEGVYMNSEVWINGKFLGKRPNGYIGFTYDLNSHLKDGKNTLVVKVDHSKPLSGRWYTGSGIYRHVWLNVNPKIHIDNKYTYYKADVEGKTASVTYNLKINNHQKSIAKVDVLTEVVTKTGNVVANKKSSISVSPGSSTLNQDFQIKNALLWSPEHPNLYHLKTTLRIGGKIISTHNQTAGFRKLEFSGAYGFKLNDSITKIKGVCLHQDAGALGVAVPDEIWLKRLSQLKEMGTNAIRTSHHPFSPVFYNICDSLGIMVLDEAFDGWETAKAADDYGNYFNEWWKIDLTDFVLRDRNHPSVIMWSIGNEVVKPTADTQKKLIDLIHSLDDRPVTQGGIDPTRGMNEKAARTQLDVKGFNGDGEEIGVFEEFHKLFPEVPLLGTEVPHTYQTRGVYRTTTNWRRRDFPAPWEIRSGQAGSMKSLQNKIYPIPDLTEKEVFTDEKASVFYKNKAVLDIPNRKPWSDKLFYQSSYDNASVRSSARKAWQRAEELPFVMGEFRWTGFDYLGETNQWPSRFANFGVIDIAGFPKDHFYLYKSLWTDEPMVHLLPHWSHPGKEGLAIPVVVYTNCDSVELWHNGKSLGYQKYVGEQLIWNVPYQPGSVKAVAYKNGKKVAEKQYVTAGQATQLLVTANKTELIPGQKNLLLYEITVADEKGIAVPSGNQMLNFKVTGPAVIKGTDNGDPLDLSDYQTNYRRAFKGKCLLILESTNEAGEIKLEISAPGLKTYSLNVNSK